jgi:uncharacterized damage-inducible protein DinB
MDRFVKEKEDAMNLYGSKELVESMRTVRKNTILIAEDISEEKYGYRPTPDSRSVAETLVHIALLSRLDHFLHEEKHFSSLEDFDFGSVIKKSETEERHPRSKSQIIDLLRTEGERWCQWVEALPQSLLSEQVRMPGGGSKSRFEMLLGTKEHEMHHRAQLMVSRAVARHRATFDAKPTAGARGDRTLSCPPPLALLLTQKGANGWQTEIRPPWRLLCGEASVENLWSSALPPFEGNSKGS